jgi:hypothetical protein
MPKTKYEPTEQNRKKVMMLAGIGVEQRHICALIGLRSEKTLRRYHANELARGIAESSTKVRQTAYRMASSRKDPAMTIFWLKTRAGWSPGMTVNRETEGDEKLIYLYEDYKPPAGSPAAPDGQSED